MTKKSNQAMFVENPKMIYNRYVNVLLASLLVHMAVC